MASYRRPELLHRALASLAAQTLPAEQYEVVVIVNGPPDESPDVVRTARGLRPGFQVRLVECRFPGAAHARQVGLWAARGEHMTFVDDDDQVSHGYLESLLARVRPGEVPLAWLCEIDEDAVGLTAPGEEPAASSLDTENYHTRALRKAIERDPETPRRAEQLISAISLNVAKLVPTALARDTAFDHDLRSASDIVFWTRFFARHPLRFRLPTDRAAFYVRTRTTGSLSRVETSWKFNVDHRLNVIAALGRIAEEQPGRRAVPVAIANAQSQLIRRYLDDHPEERAAVGAEVARRGVDLVNWRVINKDRAEDLALVYAFTPWSGTSGMVAARRIRGRGAVVDVICNRLDRSREIDPTSTAIADPWVADLRLVTYPSSFIGWKAARGYANAVMKHVRDTGRLGAYRTVYSRAMWAASHVAAATYKIHCPEVEWTAEFSDPLAHSIEGGLRTSPMKDGGQLFETLREAAERTGFTPPVQEDGLFVWAEFLAFALADQLVFTNQHQLDYMLGYCRDPALVERVRARATVSAHPTPTPDLYEIAPASYPLADDRVHLAYFGVFYVTRGLTEISDAFAALPGRVRSRVRLHVFTDKPDRIRADVTAAGLADVITVNPYRPYLEFLNLTTKFDVLVVNDATTADTHAVNPYLPSKVSDYRGSGRDVWAVYEPGSILSGLDLAHRTALGDVPAAVEVLTSLVRERFGSGPQGTGEDAGDALAGMAVPQDGRGPLLAAPGPEEGGGLPGQ